MRSRWPDAHLGAGPSPAYHLGCAASFAGAFHPSTAQRTWRGLVKRVRVCVAAEGCLARVEGYGGCDSRRTESALLIARTTTPRLIVRGHGTTWCSADAAPPCCRDSCYCCCPLLHCAQYKSSSRTREGHKPSAATISATSIRSRRCLCGLPSRQPTLP